MDSVEQWLVQIRKGVAELLVLRLLARAGELHGYAIVKELAALGRLVAGESTVYPVLRRLEADGYLASRWAASEGAPPRKYYRLTPRGASFLGDALKEWGDIVDSVERLGDR